MAELIQQTFDVLNNIDVLPTVINSLLLEYVFSMYEDKKIKTIHTDLFTNIYSTIKNNKVY